MIKWLPLTLLLAFNSFALEIYIDTAKEDFKNYSLLHIENNKQFLCQEIKNDFKATTEIICAFNQKPSQEIPQLNNDFFHIDSFIKKGVFFISIKPTFKVKLEANIFDLSKDDITFASHITLAKNWTLIGYKTKLPLIYKDEKSDNSLNFPFFLQKEHYPFVGSLDIKGNPVYIKSVNDVSKYLQVKKLYEKKNYNSALDTIDDILENYPHTLFKAELLYYRIKIYSLLRNYESVIEESKIYLREYSSDQNIAEILSLLAQSYAKVGMSSDADYFFDRLFSEHQDSVYSKWGYIYKGDMANDSGGEKEAFKYYTKALYSTKNIDVAVNASYRIANLKLAMSNKEAAKYIYKIIKAKPSFFLQHLENATKMMETFRDVENYEAASAMAKTIFNELNPSYDDYEVMLKNTALWLSKTKHKKEAIKYLNMYTKQFPDGDYINAIDIAKDALFFERDDLNDSAKLTEFNKLIKDYPKDEIGAKAVYEKAKLLLKETKYSEVLSMKDELKKLDNTTFKDAKEIVKDAAIGLMKVSLKNKNCKNVLDIAQQYEIALSNKWDDGVYDCAMMGGDYMLAKTISQKNLKSKDIDARKEWLYRYIKVDFATGNYSDLLDASKDLIALENIDNDSKYKDLYRYLFDTYDRLENVDKMIETMAKIEQLFGLTYKDIDRYVRMVAVGNERHDNNMVIKYGEKVMQIQKKSSSYAQSPYIEFTLFNAYIATQNDNKALEVISLLDNLKLTKTQRARQKYLKGSVLTKLWKDEKAQKAYKAAIKADPNSAWAKLAKTALEL